MAAFSRLGQRRKHLGHGHCQVPRMPPVWRDVGQRNQHEPRSCHARMRQDQMLGRAKLLLLRRQGAPCRGGRGIGQHRLPHGQQIKVQPARGPTRAARAARMRPQPRAVRPAAHAAAVADCQPGAGVHIVGPRPWRVRRGCEEPRYRHQPQPTRAPAAASAACSVRHAHRPKAPGRLPPSAIKIMRYCPFRQIPFASAFPLSECIEVAASNFPVNRLTSCLEPGRFNKGREDMFYKDERLALFIDGSNLYAAAQGAGVRHRLQTAAAGIRAARQAAARVLLHRAAGKRRIFADPPAGRLAELQRLRDGDQTRQGIHRQPWAAGR